MYLWSDQILCVCVCVYSVVNQLLCFSVFIIIVYTSYSYTLEWPILLDEMIFLKILFNVSGFRH